MAVSTLPVADFLNGADRLSLVDVRSPIEYFKGHIPGAVNIPLFEDHEREEIGTLYKLKGKEEAVMRGLEVVSPKLANFVKKVKELGSSGEVFIYCFRGGLRSNSFAWLMQTAGLKPTVLQGGYKAYRNFQLDFYRQKLPLVLIGGPTGGGKTRVIRALAERNEQTVDLEALAHHKGSAFGSINELPQLPQQMFEANLFHKFRKLDTNQNIFLEDEAMAIGFNKIPYPLWVQMKSAPVVKLMVPFELRVKRLVADYGNADIASLRKPLEQIRQRLGGQMFKEAIEFLEAGQLDKVAEIALAYYDEAYEYSCGKRKSDTIFTLETSTDDSQQNADLILDAVKSLKT